MLEDEDTYQKQGGRYGQQQGQPVAYFQAAINQVPQDKIGNDGGHNLPDGFADAGLLVLGNNIDPGRFLVFLLGFYC